MLFFALYEDKLLFRAMHSRWLAPRMLIDKRFMSVESRKDLDNKYLEVAAAEACGFLDACRQDDEEHAKLHMGKVLFFLFLHSAGDSLNVPRLIDGDEFTSSNFFAGGDLLAKEAGLAESVCNLAEGKSGLLEMEQTGEKKADFDMSVEMREVLVEIYRYAMGLAWYPQRMVREAWRESEALYHRAFFDLKVSPFTRGVNAIDCVRLLARIVQASG